jgi:hypothetical protein
MTSGSESHIKEALQILMDWAGCVNAIKINSVCTISNYFQPYIYNNMVIKSQKAKPQVHGERGAKLGDLPIQPLCGNMYSVGWHQAFVKGKDISFYAPANAAIAEKWVL